MTKAKVNSNFSKSKAQRILEYILLALCLCVIALRTTYTEGPATQSTALLANLSDNVYSLSVSAVLLLAFVCWFIWSLCSKRFLYRFTAIEIGLSLFCVAAFVAGIAAENKRAAITDAVCLLAPVFMAVLLVQVLDSQSKIKLVLIVIAALGVVSAYQCAEQLFVSNHAMIDQYEQAPQTMLEPLGIQPGSFQQFLFEHRLYSRGVRGFFTTSNSAGSFAILASFAAVALFIEKFKKRKSPTSSPLCFINSGIAVAVVVFGLVITRSKGAIAASVIAAAMFTAYLCFGSWIRAYKKAILIVCLLLVLTGGAAVVWYGLTYDRLPGGSSMLVRWQYWEAAVKMYADHWPAGVGPGNFAHFYTHYKPAVALESVADPHNFLLSILTQYGPLGLVGFLALVSVPLARAISTIPVASSQKTHHVEPTFRTLAVTFGIIVSLGLLLIRPIIMPVVPRDTLDVIIYVVFTLYIVPVIAFLIGFWLLTTNEKVAKTRDLGRLRGTNHETRITNLSAAALFCAILALLLHNLIDFAIFELGVFTAFWATAACLIALDFQQKSRPQFVLKPSLFARITLAAAGLLVIWAYFNYALLPVVKAAACTHRAIRSLEYAHQLLDHAAEQDRLDPTAPNLNGRLYLQHYTETPNAQPALLKKAELCFLSAIARDKADFKNYEKLSEVYNLLAKISPEHEKINWLNKALDTFASAVERYPGSAHLRVEMAKVAEQLGKTDIAIEHYKKAVDIENAYRNQFQIIYPGREIFSRLGEEKYNFAKQRIKYLTGQSTQ